MSVDDMGETISNYIQRIGELEQKVKAMTVNRTDAGMNAAALRVAQLVEDEYAKHHDGGRIMRLAKTMVEIREAMREMLVGERKWDAWRAGFSGSWPSGLRPAPEPDMMGERHADLGRLMEACGVLNDGRADPATLFQRCLDRIAEPQSSEEDK